MFSCIMFRPTKMSHNKLIFSKLKACLHFACCYGPAPMPQQKNERTRQWKIKLRYYKINKKSKLKNVCSSVVFGVCVRETMGRLPGVEKIRTDKECVITKKCWRAFILVSRAGVPDQLFTPAELCHEWFGDTHTARVVIPNAPQTPLSRAATVF